MKKTLIVLFGIFLSIQNVMAYGVDDYIEKTVRYDVGLSTITGRDSAGKITWEFDKDLSKSPVFYTKYGRSRGSFYKNLNNKYEIRSPHGNKIGYIYMTLNNEFVVCNKNYKILKSFKCIW